MFPIHDLNERHRRGRLLRRIAEPNYVAIDVCRGLRQGYVDSAPRLMEALLHASESEVEAKRVLKGATRLSASDIAKSAIRIGLKLAHCPASLKTVLVDRAFYRTPNRRS